MPDTLPARVGPYELQRVIASGGMATVFGAVDLRSGRQVAFKRILPQVAGDREFVERFRHEVRVHAALRHSNILDVCDFSAGPKDYFNVMELAGRGTLHDLAARSGPLLPEVALHIAAEVMRGLAYAHGSGIIHRDVKPHNVLITSDGTLKLADFGISKTEQMTRLTMTGALIGTPAYMSPEQVSQERVDARTDLFSTGVVLYELLAGTNPFATGDPLTTLRRVAEHDPTPLFLLDPRIPVGCELLVERLIAKAPERRPPNAKAAAEEIERALGALGTSDPRNMFALFLEDPTGFASRHRRRQSLAHLARSRALAASGRASDELALWELYQSCVLDPDNRDAAAAARQAALQAGYRLELEPPTGKVAALEQRLAAEPANAALHLQLAKLLKMQRSFPRFMHVFLRLRSLPIADRYLQGQVAALVARTGAGSAVGGESGSRPAAASGAAATDTRETTVRLPDVGPSRDPASTPTGRGPSTGPPQMPAAHQGVPLAGRARTGRDIPLGFKLGFALAGLLVLAGVLRLLLAP